MCFERIYIGQIFWLHKQTAFMLCQTAETRVITNYRVRSNCKITKEHRFSRRLDTWVRNRMKDGPSLRQLNNNGHDTRRFIKCIIFQHPERGTFQINLNTSLKEPKRTNGIHNLQFPHSRETNKGTIHMKRPTCAILVNVEVSYYILSVFRFLFSLL
jgi:hypothetical protein